LHLLLRESRSLDEDGVAEDLGHMPADILVLSFADSDLLSVERAFARRHPGCSIRVVNLNRLRHPMSVDLYVEQTVSGARCVVVRLLGGLEYWRYGAEEIAALCCRNGIGLALIPGDARSDSRLGELSTVAPDVRRRLEGFFREGGARNGDAALRLMAVVAGVGEDDGEEPAVLPPFVVHRMVGRPSASIVFYRAQLLAEDMAPIEALANALTARGVETEILAVTSPKDPAAAGALRAHLERGRPRVVLNATFFAARGEEGARSPLEAAGVPVLQLLQPGSAEAAWAESARGMSPSDLAMQLVLPELDGRIATFPVSFKAAPVEGGPLRHVPYAPGIALAAERALGWVRLSALRAEKRRVGIVLSDYPGAMGQAAHAVGLDGFASLTSILGALRGEGYGVGDIVPDAGEMARLLTGGERQAVLTLAEYRRGFAALPVEMRGAIEAAWGVPERDGAVEGDVFRLRYVRQGHVILAVQPDRGAAGERRAQYHDPDVPPRHAYVAFYLWLRDRVDVMVHLGTHGTLEWMPGKSAALSGGCVPAVLLGGLSVVYPFIVNNPGEAACAKRRLGAVTIGHMTPPVQMAGLDPEMAGLERLIDEYAEADGLDRRRGAMLRREILERAERMGVLAESGVRGGDGDEDQALARLDAYLCDVKDLQIRDGLHVFGQVAPRAEALVRAISEAGGGGMAAVETLVAQSGDAEMRALLDALGGRFVEPGPSGAPTRGRSDVLPTGRNLYTLDPRALPTRSAVELARKTERLVLTRHLQEEGEPLRRLVIDLWGSATLRTGGEDLALAFLLMGVLPRWDSGSGRVVGFEIVPLAVLDRPRVDVTLRISGLFRDAFPGQIALFDQAVRAVAERDESAEWNMLAHETRGLDEAEWQRLTARIFGPASGVYGAGIEGALASGSWEDGAALGVAYVEASSFVFGAGRDGGRDRAALESLLGRAEAILHVQDHAETDLLETPDVAAHEGGLAAAAYGLGARPRLWHGDTSRPEVPVLRDLEQEVTRIVRGRLTNPRWLAGMMRHGYRGAAEMARGVDALFGFAATVPVRFDGLFDLAYAALLEDEACDAFLREVNGEARAAMRARFAEARERGLWRPRRNSVAVALGEGE